MTKSDGLSARQLRALPIFAAQVHVEKACTEANISKQTFYQWLRQPTFNKELKRMRYEIGTDSIELLKTASKRAAITLIQLLGEDNPPAVRRSAANDVLTYVLKTREDEKHSIFGFGIDF